MDRENSSTNNNSRIRELISRLDTEHRLSLSEYEEVLKNRTEEDEKFAQELAVKWRKKIYGNGVYTRGLIEFTNYCKIIAITVVFKAQITKLKDIVLLRKTSFPAAKKVIGWDFVLLYCRVGKIPILLMRGW